MFNAVDSGLIIFGGGLSNVFSEVDATIWDLPRIKTLQSWFCSGGPTSRQSFRYGDDSLALIESSYDRVLVEAALSLTTALWDIKLSPL